MTIKLPRRGFVAGTAAGLMLPSIARAQKATTLKFIPQIDLAFLDPHWTTAYVTRNHGYMVYDTLYGQDGKFQVSPQMVAGHTVEADGKLWRLTLRPGLFWHDGTPVLARDCVASIRRWSKRDAFGGTMMAYTDELSAPDDRTIQFRLKKPFPLLPAALGRPGSPMPAMMPERLANTDPFKQITEIIGSGPYRYKADERVAGSFNAYTRFEKYQPRPDGTPDWTAGQKITHFDRVEWTTIPDAGTAANALLNGEHDWLELPQTDLLGLLKKNPKVRVATNDPTGGTEMMRMNQVQPPFNNPEIRRIVMAGFDQAEFMQSIVGDDSAMYYAPLGIFCPGTPMASTAGLEALKPGRRDYAKIKEALKKAGYAGETVALIVPSDYPALKNMSDVAADSMKKMGMTVDYIATDWSTMLQRRNKREPVAQGGWSAFITGWTGVDHLNPAGHIAMRGNGNDAGAWPGWCVSPEIERLRDAWFDAPNEAAQHDICEKIQLQALLDVPYVPLGQYLQPTAFRAEITGVLPGFATMWSVRRA